MGMSEINDYLEWRADLEGKTTDLSPEAWQWSKAMNVVLVLASDERRDSDDNREFKEWDRELMDAIDNVKQAKEALDATSN